MHGTCSVKQLRQNDVIKSNYSKLVCRSCLLLWGWRRDAGADPGWDVWRLIGVATEGASGVLQKVATAEGCC